MKKVFLLLFFVTAFKIVTYSTPINIKHLNIQKLEYTLDDFRNDPLSSLLIQQLETFSAMIKERNQMAFTYTINIDITTEALIKKYGSDKVSEYTESLAKEISSSGDELSAEGTCKRNPDGSNNYSGCNWWEKFRVFLKSRVGCYLPSTSPDYIVSERDWNIYLDCVQGIICQTC